MLGFEQNQLRFLSVTYCCSSPHCPRGERTGHPCTHRVSGPTWGRCGAAWGRRQARGRFGAPVSVPVWGQGWPGVGPVSVQCRPGVRSWVPVRLARRSLAWGYGRAWRLGPGVGPQRRATSGLASGHRTGPRVLNN
jgi:hypothetical protein